MPTRLRRAAALSLLMILSGCEGDTQSRSSTVDSAVAEDAGLSVNDRGIQTNDRGVPTIDAESSATDAEDPGPDTIEDANPPSTTDAARPDLGVPPVADASTPPSMRNLREGPQEFTITERIDGEDVNRLVIIHAPEDLDEDVSYPVVFAFHGFGGRPQSFVNQLRRLVNEHNFVGVYPQGHQESWNLGAEPSTADELAFVDQIMERLSESRQLQGTRRVGFGTSNGAGMIHTLAANTRHFEAVAALSTALIVGREPGENAGPVSVLQVHGMRDELCPYDGGESRVGHTFHSAEESIRLWAVHNGCDEDPQRLNTDQDNLRIEYRGCREETRVIHYGIRGAGHGFPGNTEGGVIDLALDFLGVL